MSRMVRNSRLYSMIQPMRTDNGDAETSCQSVLHKEQAINTPVSSLIPTTNENIKHISIAHVPLSFGLCRESRGTANADPSRERQP